MNALEYKMVEILKVLKDQFGVFQIKAEYEAEGSRQEPELMRLREVVDAADLPIILKIGGVEAVTDIYAALSLGARGIVAPMAETAFAVSKFLKAIDKFVPEDNQKDIEFAINIETITACRNLDEILALGKIHLLSSITVGRVDFCGSLGADRSFADSDEMLGYCIDIFQKAKEKGLKTAFGGAISLESIPFIEKLVSEDLLYKFETRKVVFPAEAYKHGNAVLEKALEFELSWLESKRRYYHRVTNEDEKRIPMLKQRLAGLGKKP